jgi:hypothetical protein
MGNLRREDHAERGEEQRALRRPPWARWRSRVVGAVVCGEATPLTGRPSGSRAFIRSANLVEHARERLGQNTPTVDR